MNNKNILKKSWLIQSLLLFSCAIFTLRYGQWPEFFAFLSEQHQVSKNFSSISLHLFDDVMISLRTGYIFNEIGLPAFNRTDIAQPSTSYLAPYLFAALARIMPENFAVMTYAGIGFFATLLVFATVIQTAQSRYLGGALALALTLTVTNRIYALNGWDHLLQTAFLCLGIAMIFKSSPNTLNYIVISLFLAMGTLFRPDGLIIALASIYSAYLLNKDHKKIALALILPFVLIVGGMLVLNYFQFASFLPTTVRLKFGSSPSLEYIFSYLYTSGIQYYSAITLIPILFLIYAFRHYPRYWSPFTPIFFSCVITSLIAAFNSDFVSGGRMFWASACVMALGLGFSQKNVTNKFDNGFMKYFNQLIKFIAHKLKKLFFTSDKKLNIGLGIILFPIFVYSVFSLKKPLEHSFVTGAKMYQSQTAQQYKIASWMKEHLHPKDGPIGFFTLGVSFHLAKFEIGDFLGKADELIANSPVKFGIAGHNKWDIEKSLQKWDFQAIIPEYNLDINNPTVAQNAKKILQEKTASGYSSELIFNDNLKQNFLYCYLKAGYDKELQDTFGFFLRKELSFVYLDDLFCRNISLDPPR